MLSQVVPAVLVACGLLAGTLACSGSEAPPDEHGRLKVIVDGLPAGVQGQVSVVGPRRSQQLAASAVLEVEPGTYT